MLAFVLNTAGPLVRGSAGLVLWKRVRARPRVQLLQSIPDPR